MNVFGYFSLVFSYPTAETLRDITAISSAAKYPGLYCADVLNSVALEDVQAEYTRIFISGFPHLLCPPYESYYREGLVYGNASVEVCEFYSKWGLQYTCEAEPPDLLSAELEFLALTGDEVFLERLKGWVFDFTSRVRETSELYGKCAGALEDFLKNSIDARGEMQTGSEKCRSQFLP